MKSQGMEVVILRIFLANMRASKQFNISKHIIERNIKNDDSIVKIIHTHTYTHKKKII